ncbi:hypothetical protein [Pseudoalteromonas piscicida]|uniref:Uncharacterized protein n=1 Tax=Pseudoalteromonas piscicida TaxID=43662 RepID=A0A2A5JVB2_PSEO7|nr:hypothetical protein [Pseudoalteromonas piscicida]PCK33412.1 hypothetical protein CEX98_02640 [Pseudoalteromonas piscicida]
MLTVVYGLNSPAKAFINSKHNSGNNVFACTSGQEQFEGQQSISLIDLAQIPDNQIERIVICSNFFSEICKSFDEHNIPLEKVFFFDHTRSRLLSYDQVISSEVRYENILYAVYDLSTHLPCFDVFNFAVLAEIERQRLSMQHIHFIILHNRESKDTISQSPMLFHEPHDFAWRIDKVVKAVLSCIPSHIAISEFPFRDDAIEYLKNKENIFPSEIKTNGFSPAINTRSLKNVAENVDLSVLQAPINAKKIVNQFLQSIEPSLKPVVITLREYDSQPKRNSDIAQWAQFLNNIDHNKYCPIIVRDTYLSSQQPDERLKNFIHFPHASIDFTIRLALYEQAYINMGVSCGPNYGISFIKGAKSIIFQMTDEDNPANSSLTAIRSGLEIGKDFFFNDSDLQMTIWEKDNAPWLLKTFNALVAKIEALKGD